MALGAGKAEKIKIPVLTPKFNACFWIFSSTHRTTNFCLETADNLLEQAGIHLVFIIAEELARVKGMEFFPNDLR